MSLYRYIGNSQSINQYLLFLYRNIDINQSINQSMSHLCLYRYIDGFEVQASENVDYETDGDFMYVTPADGVTEVEDAWVVITPVGEGVNKDNFRKYYN